MRTLIAVGLDLCQLEATDDAGPDKLALGGRAGLTSPIVQDDQSNGAVFGFHIRYQVLPILVLEPNITFSKYGDPDPIEGVDLGISGSKVSAFGIDATLGNAVARRGFKPYAVVGLGFYSQSNDDTDVYEDAGTKMGISGGFGFGIGISPKFDLDLRGQLHVVRAEEGGSKKAASITGGFTFYPGGN